MTSIFRKMIVKIIKKDTFIYRSYNDDSRREGYWFSLQPSETYGYGSKTGEYRILRDLKLIDITHNSFYDNLKNALKHEATLENNLKSLHPFILFPFGFDDTTFYREFAKNEGVDYTRYPLQPYIHVDSIVSFNNRSRLSIHIYDCIMMDFLKKVFGKECDGILSDCLFPDTIRNGYQVTELSVFDTSTVEYTREYPRVTIGGTSNNYILPPLRLKETESMKEAKRLASEILPTLRISTHSKPQIILADKERRKTRKNYISTEKENRNRDEEIKALKEQVAKLTADAEVKTKRHFPKS